MKPPAYPRCPSCGRPAAGVFVTWLDYRRERVALYCLHCQRFYYRYTRPRSF